MAEVLVAEEDLPFIDEDVYEAEDPTSDPEKENPGDREQMNTRSEIHDNIDAGHKPEQEHLIDVKDKRKTQDVNNLENFGREAENVMVQLANNNPEDPPEVTDEAHAQRLGTPACLYHVMHQSCPLMANAVYTGRVCPPCVGRPDVFCKLCLRHPSQLHCAHKCPSVKHNFTWIALCLMVLGLVLYLWDTVSDIMLANEYFAEGEILWGGITLALVVVAGISMTSLNLHQWTHVRSKFIEAKFPVSIFSVGFIVTAFLLVTPAMWLVVLIFLWTKGRQFLNGHLGNFIDFPVMERDIHMSLRKSQMVEAFVEAGPQLLLQLYIVFSSTWQGVSLKFFLQVVSSVSSVFSLSWTMVSLYCSFHPFDHQYHFAEKNSGLFVAIIHHTSQIFGFGIVCLFIPLEYFDYLLYSHSCSVHLSFLASK